MADLQRMKLAPLYVVEIPLEAPDRWYDLCRCETAPAVGAVLAQLLAYRHMPGDMVRVRVEMREVIDE